MKKETIAFFFKLIILFAASPTQAVTLRYTIVIGNNIGVDSKGKQPFAPLLHAEREAKRLTERLIQLANFDSSPKRTKLLLNTNRASVVAAFKALAEQRKKDAELFQDSESIFLLYFTGHGIAGKLLLSDGAMNARQIAALFNNVDADFSVGVFDACYAGSFDDILKKKGIRPTLGVNFAPNMPEQILSAKGSIWFVSSGANEPSFEDVEKGGVFTHFFIEALNDAQRDGPGITLDQIWNYARTKTIAYTMKHNKRQTPEQFVSKLRSKAPVYFSFPSQPNATLVLSPQLQGTFALSYSDGHLVKVFEKQAGKKKRIDVFPGSAQFYVFGGRQTERTQLSLKKNETLYIHSLPEIPPAVEKGQYSQNLFPKGIGFKDNITVTAIRPRASLVAGAGYEGSFTHWKMLHPRHRIYIPLRIDWQRVYLGLRLIYGYDQRKNHIDTPHAAHMAAGGLFAGIKKVFHSFELNVGSDLGVGYIWQRFEQSEIGADDFFELTGGKPQFPKNYIDKKWEASLNAVLGALFPKTGHVFFELASRFGFLVAPGAALYSTYKLNVAGGLSLTVYFRGG
ncbi:MAG: caspase family protein [Deltaproteobacteria bacterium]|nr:caspase family protein [Deltaproteobacteria bacterium]